MKFPLAGKVAVNETCKAMICTGVYMILCSSLYDLYCINWWERKRQAAMFCLVELLSCQSAHIEMLPSPAFSCQHVYHGYGLTHSSRHKHKNIQEPNICRMMLTYAYSHGFWRSFASALRPKTRTQIPKLLGKRLRFLTIPCRFWSPLWPLGTSNICVTRAEMSQK